MIYNQASLIGGELTQGIQEGWNWTKNGGGYVSNRDFFSVHYEVQEKDPTNVVRLHIETPKYIVDPFLNNLKQQVLDALFSSDIAAVVEKEGYGYKRGGRISQTAVHNNKCTEAFRVVLNNEQSRQTAKQNIAVVHEAIGSRIDTVIQRFSLQLSQHFHS